MESVVDALREITVWPVHLDPDDSFVPLAALDLEAYVDAVRTRLGAPPRRVAESAVVMGLASRLWAASLVPAVRSGVLPDPARLLARHVDGALDLGVREPIALPRADEDAVLGVIDLVLAPVIGRLAVSSQLLWTNVAATLDAVPRIYALPDARPVVDRLLAHAPLAGHLVPDGPRSRRASTCCLFYEVRGAGLCGDCVFDVAPRS